MKMQGNTILITGATSGIGLELARQWSELNNQVIVTGRNIEKLAKVRDAFPAIQAIQSDVTNEDDVHALFTRVANEYPKINILVNNAGIGSTQDLRKQQDGSGLVKEIKTNLEAPIQMINHFLPLLLRQPEAAILNVTSALAFLPYPIVPIYSAAKAGLRSYTLSLRTQLRGTGVRVYELAPPTTETEMLNGFRRSDLKDVSIMKASEVARVTIREMEKNNCEICPGQASRLRLMSRLAPSLVLRKMSQSLERSH